MAEEQVILVDADDREVGAMDKLSAHEKGGVRHRAFSVFVVDPQGIIRYKHIGPLSPRAVEQELLPAIEKARG